MTISKWREWEKKRDLTTSNINAKIWNDTQNSNMNILWSPRFAADERDGTQNAETDKKG